MSKEGLHTAVVKNFNDSDKFVKIENLASEAERSLHFALQCNGLFLLNTGEWLYDKNSITPLLSYAQEVSFFGPNHVSSSFFKANVNSELFTRAALFALNQTEVIRVVEKYRTLDPDLAARVSYLLGGIVRDRVYSNAWIEEGGNDVRFAAKMSFLGEKESADAVASAIAMYVISDGPRNPGDAFAGQIYHMSEAISENPIKPNSTPQLGLSQTLKLRSYDRRRFGLSENTESDIPLNNELFKSFKDFPTVGAEFHFPQDASKKYPEFWQRLALLNMSQYQRGSYIQLSRLDQGVIEVRMNPSIYPVTIANWRYMKQILPELQDTYFTITFNRRPKDSDFTWKNDENLLRELKAVGMLTYAGIYSSIPEEHQDGEIHFGNAYLGQTVRLQNDEYHFTGNWSGKEGQGGQLGMYVGFGNNLPELAYYGSMALAEPRIMKSVNGLSKDVKNLREAIYMEPYRRKNIFRTLQHTINHDKRLREAAQAGAEIEDLLKL